MDSKQRLLNETRGKQMIYETLLELSKQEESQVALQISNLQQNFEFFRTKLDEIKNNPLAAPLPETDFALDEDEKVLSGKAVLAWPVSPSGGISAFYHDESYKAAVGIQHNAVDIRVAQGSRVRAAADGVVTKVAENGFAYSYIIIAHANKIITLYGHMSEMLVSEGEIVRQGQVIGLSGGIPGTKGAGWLTTGAHLHLEVFNNWQHVDPLEYLPLEYLDQANLPEKYLKNMLNF
jgi:murein DD-endopeptidase MepM/ murein hydrolase activator NlpD